MRNAIHEQKNWAASIVVSGYWVQDFLILRTNNLKRAKHFFPHFFSHSIVYLEITSKKGKKKSSRSHVVDISFNTHGTCLDVGSSFLLPLPPVLSSNTRQHLVERVYIMLNTKVSIRRHWVLGRRLSVCKVPSYWINDIIGGCPGFARRVERTR